jgi:hypothetical protein
MSEDEVTRARKTHKLIRYRTNKILFVKPEGKILTRRGGGRWGDNIELDS